MIEPYESEPRSEKSESEQKGPPPLMSKRGEALAKKSAPCSAFDTKISDVRDSLRKAASR